MRKHTARLLQRLTFTIALGFSLFALAQQPPAPPSQATPQTAPAPAAPGAKRVLAPLDPGAWTVRSYRYPSDALISGYVYRERGQLTAPVMPPASASAADFEGFIRRSNDVVTTHLRFEAVALPAGSLAVFDPKSRTLVVRTTNAIHDQIQTLAMETQARLSRYLNFSVHLLEADAAVVREVVSQCATLSDHTPALGRTEDLAAKGQARHLGTLRLDTTTGQRARISRATKHAYPVDYQFDEGGQLEFTREVRPVGTIFEIEPSIDPDQTTVHVTYNLEHHFAPPTRRFERAGQRGKQTVEAQVTDFHRVTFHSTTTLLAGTSKLLGVWTPESEPAAAAAAAGAGEAPPAPDRTQLAFLKCDVVHLLPSENKRASQILQEHGEKVLPTPKTPPPPTADLPAGMILRRFQVAMEAISAKASSGASEVPADPFAGAAAAPMPNEPRMEARVTVLDVLRAQGIPFPTGSSANYNSATSELLVRNTPANMALVETWLSSLKRNPPKTIVTTLHLVQADAATLRKIEAESAISADNTSAFKALEAEVAAGKAKILRTCWLETRDTKQASTEIGNERMHVTAVEVLSGSGTKEDSSQPAPTANRNRLSSAAIRPIFLTENAGLRLNVQPTVSSDGQTVRLTYALVYDFAPPLLRRNPAEVGEQLVRLASDTTDFHQTDQSGTITLLPSTMHLLGMWKPTAPNGQENDAVLQAAFLRTDVVRAEPDEVK